MSAVVSPIAPSSIATRTCARMRSSSSGGRRTVVEADLVRAHRRRADERRDVGRDAARHQVIEIAAERVPDDVELDVALALHLVFLHLLGERPHRALAEHFERHALPQRPLRAAVFDERRLGVAEHVDEAGRDGEPGRVDLLASALGAEITGGRDAIVEDGEVAHLPRGAGAVVDRAVPDHDVVLRRLRAAGENGRGQSEKDEERPLHGDESVCDEPLS